MEMSGPKYPGIVESHSYGPVGVKVRGEMVVTGPVYPADPANKFRETPFNRNKKTFDSFRFDFYLQRSIAGL